jgi:hypothetical protein
MIWCPQIPLMGVAALISASLQDGKPTGAAMPAMAKITAISPG